MFEQQDCYNYGSYTRAPLRVKLCGCECSQHSSKYSTFTCFDRCIVLVAVFLIIARATCVLVTKSKSM